MVRRRRWVICWGISGDVPLRRRPRCGWRRRKARPLFPPVKNQRVRHGMAMRSVLSCSGRLELRRGRYQSEGGGTEVPVSDGADWIANLVESSWPARTTVILDFFHASQHVHQTRRIVFGNENADGNTWADQLLGRMSQGSWDDASELMVQTRSRLRSKARRTSLDDLMRYLIERREKVDYASFRAAGYDVGSGPTESMCKSLSRRMKGIGMRWTGKNAEAMVALESLHQSNL